MTDTNQKTSTEIIMYREKKYDALREWCKEKPEKMLSIAYHIFKDSPNDDNSSIMKAAMYAYQTGKVEMGYAAL